MESTAAHPGGDTWVNARRRPELVDGHDAAVQ